VRTSPTEQSPRDDASEPRTWWPEHRASDLPAIRALRDGVGPYLFCDYWASVFRLRSIPARRLLETGLVSLEHFRKAIDRPLTRLPKLRYYILAFVLVPALFPYKVVYDIMRLLRGRAEKVAHPVHHLMDRYELALEEAGEGRVHVRAGSKPVGEDLIDPDQIGVEVSFFYPTYKLLIAGLCSVALSMGVLPLLWRFELLAPLETHVNVIAALLLALLLHAVFRDLVTALLAPLPILAVHLLIRAPDSRGDLLLAAIGFIGLYYAVEWFFLPRPLPPSLFLYVNRPDSELFPYERQHAPYWLEGEHYWVWRFLVYAPGELTKFWEKDWERVEVWVRADGPRAGRIEWVVNDCHYRELWFRYERLVGEHHGQTLDWHLERGLEADRRLLWIIESDMDLLFHAPFVRGIFLADRDAIGFRASLARLLRALWVRPRSDRYERYARALAELEVDGAELLADVPEHVRGLTLRSMVRMPWDYWRYPLGAATAPHRFVYEDIDRRVAPAPPAADPHLQVKRAGPDGGQIGRGGG
jgi:hypothetical protein